MAEILVEGGGGVFRELAMFEIALVPKLVSLFRIDKGRTVALVKTRGKYFPIVLTMEPARVVSAPLV